MYGDRASVGQDQSIEAQLNLCGLMSEPQSYSTDRQDGALDRCAEWNENPAAFVDGGDQDAGDLCARTRGIGADGLLDANFEGCTGRDGFRGKGRGEGEESETAGRNEITEPVRQARLLLVHFLPRGHGVSALRQTLSRLRASRRREVKEQLAEAGKLS